MNGVGVDFIQLRRRPATVARSLRDFERVSAFLMSSGLSKADAAKAIELSGKALLMPGEKISCVGVVDYRGEELSCAEHRLEPKRVYRFLRCREALERAAAAIGRGQLPVLDGHVDVDTADDEELARVCIGEFGDVTFTGPFLRASVVVTRPSAIQAIKTRERRAWSIGYGILDLKIVPGTHNGKQYDGEIRDLELTHVGLVRESRAGVATRISYPGGNR